MLNQIVTKQPSSAGKGVYELMDNNPQPEQTSSGNNAGISGNTGNSMNETNSKGLATVSVSDNLVGSNPNSNDVPKES